MSEFFDLRVKAFGQTSLLWAAADHSKDRISAVDARRRLAHYVHAIIVAVALESAPIDREAEVFGQSSSLRDLVADRLFLSPGRHDADAAESSELRDAGTSIAPVGDSESMLHSSTGYVRGEHSGFDREDR